MTAYLFIDGGFFESLVAKAENAYGLKLSRFAFDYGQIRSGFQRAFYYDARPSKKPKETQQDFDARLSDKLKLFDRINRTEFMHVREGKTRRAQKDEQKGVDILLAIDVLRYAYRGSITQAHIMASDLDFFPLLEALRETPVTVYLHCFMDQTSPELMSLADVVKPISPYTVLKWFSYRDRESFAEYSVPVGELVNSKPIKEGTYQGAPYYIYKDERLGKDQPFYGRSMSMNSHAADRSSRWEYIVWRFQDLYGPIYFDRLDDLDHAAGDGINPAAGAGVTS